MLRECDTLLVQNSDNALLIFSWIGFAGELLETPMRFCLVPFSGDRRPRSCTLGRSGTPTEIQLLETGFLSIFLCPLFDGRRFQVQPPILVIWLFRWLGFRIMIGQGLIELRGELMLAGSYRFHYHDESAEPIRVPSVAIFTLRRSGSQISRRGGTISSNWWSWFSFGPRHVGHIAGVLLVTFQIFLIISGNLSFLELPNNRSFLACFDDTFLRRFLPRAIVRRAECAIGTGRLTTRSRSRCRSWLST